MTKNDGYEKKIEKVAIAMRLCRVREVALHVASEVLRSKTEWFGTSTQLKALGAGCIGASQDLSGA